MRGRDTQVQFTLPELPPWAQRLLGGLFLLYAAELFARNTLGVDVDALIWRPFERGFAWYQPLTRYLIQGNGVMGVVLGMMVLYFFLPPLAQLLDRRQATSALAFVAAGSIAVGMGLDALHLAGGAAAGWSSLVTASVILYGLGFPSRVIYLFFVLPVPASILVYGTAALSLLYVLADPSLQTATHFGSIVGAYAWWQTLGPGGRRRALLAKSRTIEAELRGFQVLQGGKNGPGPDDIVH